MEPSLAWKSQRWPWNSDLLILPKYWDHRYTLPHLVLCSVGDQTEGFVYDRQVAYPPCFFETGSSYAYYVALAVQELCGEQASLKPTEVCCLVLWLRVCTTTPAVPSSGASFLSPSTLTLPCGDDHGEQDSQNPELSSKALNSISECLTGSPWVSN